MCGLVGRIAGILPVGTGRRRPRRWRLRRRLSVGDWPLLFDLWRVYRLPLIWWPPVMCDLLLVGMRLLPTSLGRGMLTIDIWSLRRMQVAARTITVLVRHPRIAGSRWTAQLLVMSLWLAIRPSSLFGSAIVLFLAEDRKRVIERQRFGRLSILLHLRLLCSLPVLHGPFTLRLRRLLWLGVVGMWIPAYWCRPYILLRRLGRRHHFP